MRVLAVSVLATLVSVLVACEGTDESGSDESMVVAGNAIDETAPPESLAPAPLDRSAVEMLDVRGVGDSAWSETHKSTPLAAEFGAALDRFDASGKGYRGDLSFINWETVVGRQCTT